MGLGIGYGCLTELTEVPIVAWAYRTYSKFLVIPYNSKYPHQGGEKTMNLLVWSKKYIKCISKYCDWCTANTTHYTGNNMYIPCTYHCTLAHFCYSCPSRFSRSEPFQLHGNDFRGHRFTSQIKVLVCRSTRRTKPCNITI